MLVPVDVPGLGIDGHAVRVAQPAARHSFVGAVRLHRKDAASAEVENEQTAGSAGSGFDS